MFGSYKRAMRRRIESLGAVLEHVGVYACELVVVDGGRGVSAMLTAENVLLRQAEEVEALREQLDKRHSPTQDVLMRNLGYERQMRSADRIAYTDALRAAGREKGELTIARDKAHYELNEIVDVLVSRGVLTPPEDGTEIDLPAVIAEVLDGLMGVAVLGAVGEAEGGEAANGCGSVAELSLRDQAQLAIAAVCEEDGSFDAGKAFGTYSRMSGGRYEPGEFLWDCEGLASLGYYHVPGTQCTWARCDA